MTKVSRRNAITRAAMQNLDKQIWRSRITILTKLKLYNNCILPIFLYGSWVLCSHQERCTQDRRPRPMVSAKAVRNQMVPSRAEWRGETDNRATPACRLLSKHGIFSVRPYCKNARRDRCQEYHNCFPFRELEETTRTSSNYVDEDYPARPQIKQSLTGWGCISKTGLAKEETRMSDVTVFSHETQNTRCEIRPVCPAVVKRLPPSWIRSCCCCCFPAPLTPLLL